MADQWKQNKGLGVQGNSRRCWNPLLAGLSFAFLTLSNLAPAKAQVPFVCDGRIFISQGTSTLPPTDPRPILFNDVNTGATPFTLNQIGPDNPFEYNAIGYNVQDNLIYGIVPRNQGAVPQGTVVQVDSTGTVRTVGTINGGTNPPAGLPPTNGYIGGELDENGFYYIFGLPMGANPATITRIRITNGAVDGAFPTVVNTIAAVGLPPIVADFAFNPVDERFYGYDSRDGQMVSFQFDPAGGAINLDPLPNSSPPGGSGGFGAIGAAFFDAAGNFFGYQNSGALFRININPGVSDRYTLISSATQVGQNDGTACPYTPVFSKTVNPTTAAAGDTITYSYEIVNGSVLDLTTITFGDTMSDGRTFIPGTFTVTNATGGTVSLSNGNSVLSVTNLTVAARTTATASVQVQLPADLPTGTFLNQATLNGQFATLGTVFSARSEFPVTSIFPDPTPVDVTSAPNNTTAANLLLVKRITGITRNGSSLSGVDFGSFVDDPDDANDNAAGWSDLSPVGILGLDANNPLQSNDEVEYTIYFLSDGGQPVTNVRVCDRIHPQTTFISSTFGDARGISLRQGTTVTTQSNAVDGDRAQFVSPLTPVNSLIPPCPNSSNTNGLVFVNLGDVTNSGTNRVGFVRFRVRVN